MLALDGGAPEVKTKIRPRGMGIAPLSGYLGGELRGGPRVQSLEEDWARAFGVKHAIACNSATSGLLAACAAAGVSPDDEVTLPCFTMSATASAPALLGARLHFCDVEDQTFTLANIGKAPPKALIAVNLFGHPANVTAYRKQCDRHGSFLIEDNSQAPFATECGKLTGTIGHIGVFSLNVHKHMECGEGGICVTDNDDLARQLRLFINHGEMAGERIGLNLRMTESVASYAHVQLDRGKVRVNDRVEQAEKIIAAIGVVPGLRLPIQAPECRHTYYVIPLLVEKDRSKIVAALRAEGVPLVEGYVAPLYRLPAFRQFARPCPVAEALHDRRLLYFENCAWDPTNEQIAQIGAAFRKVFERMKG